MKMLLGTDCWKGYWDASVGVFEPPYPQVGRVVTVALSY